MHGALVRLVSVCGGGGCAGGGARVVNVTAVDGLGNAEATGLLVNLWTV